MCDLASDLSSFVSMYRSNFSAHELTEAKFGDATGCVKCNYVQHWFSERSRSFIKVKVQALLLLSLISDSLEP